MLRQWERVVVEGASLLTAWQGMNDTAHHPSAPVVAFEAAFVRVQGQVETVCSAEPDWPTGVAAGVRVAFAYAAAHPDDAQVLTNEAMAVGKDGFARYDRMIEHFGELLLPGRTERPEGESLPEITEKLMVGGLASLIAQRLDFGRHVELPALAPEAIQFVLTPYLGSGEARRVAVS